MNDLCVSVNGKNIDEIGEQLAEDFEVRKLSDVEYLIILNRKSYRAVIKNINEDSGNVLVSLNDKDFDCYVSTPLDQTIEALDLSSKEKAYSKNLVAIMPGMVLDVMVSKGQIVQEGDPLMILEAMKMENVLKAASEGLVKEVYCNASDAVEKGQLLIEIE